MDTKSRNIFASENVYIDKIPLINKTTGKLNSHFIPITFLENKGEFTRRDIDKGEICLSVDSHESVLTYKNKKQDRKSVV